MTQLIIRKKVQMPLSIRSDPLTCVYCDDYSNFNLFKNSFLAKIEVNQGTSKLCDVSSSFIYDPLTLFINNCLNIHDKLEQL